MTANRDKPVALGYGKHVVAGNLMLRHDDEGFSMFVVGLGESESDGVDELRLNGLVLDSSKYEFHPGKDGATLAGPPQRGHPRQGR